MADQETVEEALIGRRSRRNATSDAGDGAVNKGELSSTSSSSDDEEEANKKSKNNVYLDKNGGIENLAANLKTVDFQKVLNNVVSDAVTEKAKGIVSGVCLPPSLGHDSQDEQGKAKGSELVCGVCPPPSTGHDSQDEAEKANGFVSGICLPPSLPHDSQSSVTVRKGKEVKTVVEEVEEVVQLEFFDREVNKLQTHYAYCPNCSSRITKVILRRVRREASITTMEDHPDLLGCLSCFSIFVHIGKNFKPFPIFGSGEGTTETAREPHL